MKMFYADAITIAFKSRGVGMSHALCQVPRCEGALTDAQLASIDAAAKRRPRKSRR